MITLLIILAVAFVLSIVLTFALQSIGWAYTGMATLFLLVFGFVACFNASFHTQHLSGYVYSSETNIGGYTTAHIRFSQNAGQDVQPSFCVKADSEAGKKITEVTGTDIKVEITIPNYLYIANSLWACGSPDTTVKVVEAK